jgi:hypothetical protein
LKLPSSEKPNLSPGYFQATTNQHSRHAVFLNAPSANDQRSASYADAVLKVIVAELITKVITSVTIDSTLRESARAK